MNIDRISGIVHYKWETALLAENTQPLALLAIDVPPQGHIREDDVAAAYNYLHRFLGVEDGEALTIFGFRDHIGPRPLILVVRLA